MKKKYVSNKPVVSKPDWVDNIPGYPYYHVTTKGKVYTRKRVNAGKKRDTGGGDNNSIGLWRELTSVEDSSGRLRVCLQSPEKKRLYTRVHRLVALVYIPNPDNKPFVCHKDNNPKNNKVSNLYWGTQSENILQCVRDGRHFKSLNHEN